jgi:hypothetical protein
MLRDREGAIRSQRPASAVRRSSHEATGHGEVTHGDPKLRDLLRAVDQQVEVLDDALPREVELFGAFGAGQSLEGGLREPVAGLALFGLAGLQLVAEGHELIDPRDDALLLGERREARGSCAVRCRSSG